MDEFDLSAVKEKWGKLPIWVWAVLAGGVILAGYYVWRTMSANKKTAASSTTTDIYEGINDDTVADNIAGGLAENTSYETNESWLKKAMRLAIENGYQPTAAQINLQNYLGGLPVVGASARRMLDIVLNTLGTPPDGTYGIPQFVDETSTPVVPGTDSPDTTPAPTDDGSAERDRLAREAAEAASARAAAEAQNAASERAAAEQRARDAESQRAADAARQNAGKRWYNITSPAEYAGRTYYTRASTVQAGIMARVRSTQAAYLLAGAPGKTNISMSALQGLAPIDGSN